MQLRDHLIVHYHEVGLKGGNRSTFERALVRNIVRAASDLGELQPRRLPGRILVPVPEGVSAHELAARMQDVYGIANIGIARGGRLDFEGITRAADELMSGGGYETFAVRARPCARAAMPRAFR